MIQAHACHSRKQSREGLCLEGAVPACRVFVHLVGLHKRLDRFLKFLVERGNGWPREGAVQFEVFMQSLVAANGCLDDSAICFSSDRGSSPSASARPPFCDPTRDRVYESGH
jgi:hypothetical protein